MFFKDNGITYTFPPDSIVNIVIPENLVLGNLYTAKFISHNFGYWVFSDPRATGLASYEGFFFVCLFQRWNFVATSFGSVRHTGPNVADGT